MSLNKRKELSIIAKKLCRELRINQTPLEKLIWDGIRNRRLLSKNFLRQHPIFFDLTGKETFYIADFYCHELKLVIEIDGEIHKFRSKKDNERDNVLNHLGMKVVRITSEMVMMNPGTALKFIKDCLIGISNSP
jgi:very-short-patch-repair endonuclease